MKILKPFLFFITSCISSNNNQNQNSSFVVEYSKYKIVNVGSIINIKNNTVDIYSKNIPFKISSDFTLIGQKTINSKECVVISVKMGPFLKKNVNICNRFHENKSLVLSDNGEKIIILRKINDLNVNDLNDDTNRYDLLT
jgi:hypothetical protein